MKHYILFGLLIVAAGCGGNNSGSQVKSPGDSIPAKDALLDKGADLMQDKTPFKNFNTYLDGFHFYNGNINAQMEAHHYVNQLNADLYQAIIFDGNGKDAKLMGVEYIITERLFKTLPEEEKKLWHSHHHEVKSGSLVAPGIPLAAEHELMEKLVSTYGKTIHTWHTDQERTLPVGSPMVMMGFTKEGQLKKELLDDRDKRFDISTEKIKKSRADIPMPQVAAGANAWEKGEIRQFVISSKADSALHKH
ncbi:OBAP family protein [Dyadobacter sp. CY343]|uniref:OBAP family protein n=1 Tax=Dyadobacter sp. CY343 TaxID=2907299 RepID=UPI001F29C2AD|nr:OBAP family protein [Dyadobacter sp. CY343]MCE7063325.1 OBAP family protein [Dyadobacter sp. CY343]